MDNQNKEVVINGKKLKCLICGGADFSTRKSLLNTRTLTFLNLDWANNEAINYICEDCGYIFWFTETSKQYIEDVFQEKQLETEKKKGNYEKCKADENECPNCFSQIGKEDEVCTNCGFKIR